MNTLEQTRNRRSSVFLFKYFIYLFEGREKERREISVWEMLIGCLSNALNWRPGLKPRHIPCLVIEWVTFVVHTWHSVHWTPPVRTEVLVFKNILYCNEKKISVVNIDAKILNTKLANWVRWHIKQISMTKWSLCQKWKGGSYHQNNGESERERSMIA